MYARARVAIEPIVVNRGMKMITGVLMGIGIVQSLSGDMNQKISRVSGINFALIASLEPAPTIVYML